MTKPRPDTKNIARRQIHHYLFSFCMSHIHENPEAEYPRTHGSISGLVTPWNGSSVKVGDLVVLESAPASKWNIGWLVEFEKYPSGDGRYLIESLEDGSECWWTNVGLNYLPRHIVKRHPEWRWTDRQWAFRKKWISVCQERSRYYVPLYPVFGKDHEVTLSIRTKYQEDDVYPKHSFLDWRKVTRAMMAQCFEELIAKREFELEARRLSQGAS